MSNVISMLLRAAGASLLLVVTGCHLAAPPTIRQADVNGVSLRYLDQGNGTPVVMVHGALLDHRSWELQREAIAKSYRYVALDQRYYGSAPWPDDGAGYSFATHLDDLAAFIRNLDTGPVHLVGWSHGASLGLALAAKRPELIRSLFLYEPALLTVVTNPGEQELLGEELKGMAPVVEASQANDQARALGLFAQWVNNGEAAPAGRPQPEWFGPIFEDNARALPLVLNDVGDSAVTCDDLKRIRAPVVIAKGEHTRAFFNVLADATSRCVPRSRVLTIPDSTHSGPIQNAEAFNTALLGFLADHRQ